jgi:hypothetical protein
MHGRITNYFSLAPLLVLHFRKVRPALLASVTYGVHTDSVTISWAPGLY